ncbi:MAG: hypothetical protein BWY51_00288 [Parcubacteria group bacterium ADurb.Bin316]|nr:MAG: hypothetical protein BWY51_00288 [Parcubacteria group bacterium ADurb.Bin316]HOZ56058.1 hypothetical protein [bacterium]
MNQKGAGLLGLLIVAAIVGLLAYGGYSFWNKDKKTDINNLQQVEDNINETRQNPVELHNIKMKATEEINKINQTIKEQASSTDNYLE